MWPRSWKRKPSSAAQCRFPGASEGVPVPATEDVARGVWAPAPRQDAVGVRAQRHFAALAALGQLQADHASRPVDAIPAERERLTSAYAREHAELHEFVQALVRALSAGGTAPHEQASEMPVTLYAVASSSALRGRRLRKRSSAQCSRRLQSVPHAVSWTLREISR